MAVDGIHRTCIGDGAINLEKVHGVERIPCLAGHDDLPRGQ